MNREEFCRHHWEYYLVLEKDFLQSERYVSFDLGGNYLYDTVGCSDAGNSLTFSNEYVKQYQAICSEVDVVLKSICRELNDPDPKNMERSYTPVVLGSWPDIRTQKVNFRDIELQPFSNWSDTPYRSPDWWSPYNHVKHERIDNYKSANLKNVLNALAGLFVLENYLVKYIGNRDGVIDVPNDISSLFEMIDFETRETVIGRNAYVITDQDFSSLF